MNLVRRTVENGLQVVEVRLHPEASLIVRVPQLLDADDELGPEPGLPSHRIQRLRELVQNAVSDLPPIRMWQRRLTGTPEVSSVEIRIDPPKQDQHWTKPVTLAMDIIVWQHEEKQWLANVPTLGIEIFAKDRETLDSRVRNHIRFALQRRRWSSSLKHMVQLARFVRTTLETHQTTLKIETPKQIEMAEGEPTEAPVLKDVADQLDGTELAPAFEVQRYVTLIAEALAATAPRSVLLIGPSGVGKTAIINEVVRQRRKRGLGGTHFWGTSGSRLVAGMCGFGMWQERCDKMCRELREQKAVLYSGNLPELVEAGKGGGNSQGIADFLRTRMDRNEIVVVAECSPEQFSVLERVAPGVLQSFMHIRIEEPELNPGRQILLEYSLWAAQHQQRVRERIEYKKRKKELKELTRISADDFVQPDIRIAPKQVGEPLSVAAIEKVDRLHRRYSAYSAYPGRAIRFLYNLIEDRGDSDQILEPQHITEAFADETGLPLMLLDESQPLDPATVRDWFRERVIGQHESVDVIVDLIASVKAGLTRPERPIASLLFVGPTGVGKTEMAKTITEFFFRDRGRMIRFDMSEYSDPAAIDRLVGGPGRPEGLLTAKVRDQPFGVILLDEFEKAHPRFFDLLLQVLGEGRLTDAEGNLADFRNSIIVMTSNLGVESTSRGSVGFDGPDDGDSDAAYSQLQDHFVREVQSFLRPEMFNRIDRIVPFRALDRDTLRLITQRELNLVRNRDGIQFRGIDLQIGEQVIDRLVAEGHDLRYGARPLKRAIEEHLLKPLATQSIAYDPSQPIDATVAAADSFDDVLAVEVKGKSNTADSTGIGVRDPSMMVMINEVSNVRRNVFLLDSGSVSIETRNELYRFDSVQEKRVARYEQKIAAGQINVPYPSPEPELVERIAHFRDYQAELERVRSEAIRLEDELLVSFYDGEPFEKELVEDATTDLVNQWQQLLRKAYALTYVDVDADRITLCIWFNQDSADFVDMLLKAYQEVIQRNELRVGIYSLRPPENLEVRLKEDEFWIAKPKEGEAYEGITTMIGQKRKAQSSVSSVSSAVYREDVIGIALRVRGSLATPLLEAEVGRHEWKRTNSVQRCLIETTSVEVEKLLPAPVLDGREVSQVAAVRTWNDRTRRIEAPGLRGEGMVWTRSNTADCLAKLLQDRLIEQANRLIE